MEVEVASPDDAERLAQLIGELLEEIMMAIGQQAFNFDYAEAVSRLTEYLESEKCFILIIRGENEGILGFVAMYESVALYAEGEFGTISEFFVSPEYRSQGLGRLLSSAAKRFANERGWSRLEVTTPPLPEFDRTLAFYEKQGFSVTGGRKLKCVL